MSESSSVEQRFAGLENASRNLSADVTALNNTLQVVADLQRKQRDSALAQQKTDTEVAEQKKKAIEQDRRQRNALRTAATVVLLLLAAASFLVYFTMLRHVNGLLEQQKRDRYTSCVARNEGTKENIRRERVLSRIDDTAEKRQLHAVSAEQLGKSIINCAAFR